MFLAPKFFGGEPPKFLEWDFKITPDSDHVAKFQGDRSRDLGERVAKKKITSRVKHKPVRNYRSGRPNYFDVNVDYQLTHIICFSSFVFLLI